jgi:hypothetical protein
MLDKIGNVHCVVKKEDRTYTFILPIGAPLGEAYDACFKVLEEIVEMSKVAVERAKPAEQPIQPEVVNN